MSFLNEVKIKIFFILSLNSTIKIIINNKYDLFIVNTYLCFYLYFDTFSNEYAVSYYACIQIMMKSLVFIIKNNYIVENKNKKSEINSRFKILICKNLTIQQ